MKDYCDAEAPDAILKGAAVKLPHNPPKNGKLIFVGPKFEDLFGHYENQ